MIVYVPIVFYGLNGAAAYGAYTDRATAVRALEEADRCDPGVMGPYTCGGEVVKVTVDAYPERNEHGLAPCRTAYDENEGR